jgi:anaphase-promoting complex subunit 8
MPTQVATQPAPSMTPARHPHAPQINPVLENAQDSEKILENEEEDALQAARASFEAREFYHATHLLQDCRSAKARFLRIYSQFIVSANNGSYSANTM